MTTTPRAYTEDELRDQFIDHVRDIATYWGSEERREGITSTERCFGTVHSILALLDGCAIGFPGIDLVLEPHESDKEYHINLGENWIEPGTRLSYNLCHYLYRKD